MKWKRIWDKNFGVCYKLQPTLKRTEIKLKNREPIFPSKWGFKFFILKDNYGYKFRNGYMYKGWVKRYKKRMELRRMFKCI